MITYNIINGQGLASTLELDNVQFVRAATGGDLWLQATVRRAGYQPAYAVGNRLVARKGIAIIWQGLIERIETQALGGGADILYLAGDGKRLDESIAGGDTALQIIYNDNSTTLDGWSSTSYGDEGLYRLDNNQRLYIGLQSGVTYPVGSQASWIYLAPLTNAFSIIFDCRLPAGGTWRAQAFDPGTATVLQWGGVSTSTTPSRYLYVTGFATAGGVQITLSNISGSPQTISGEYYFRVAAIVIYARVVGRTYPGVIAAGLASELNGRTVANPIKGQILTDSSQIDSVNVSVIPATWRLKSYKSVLTDLVALGNGGVAPYDDMVATDAPAGYWPMSEPSSGGQLDRGSYFAATGGAILGPGGGAVASSTALVRGDTAGSLFYSASYSNVGAQYGLAGTPYNPTGLPYSADVWCNLAAGATLGSGLVICEWYGYRGTVPASLWANSLGVDGSGFPRLIFVSSGTTVNLVGPRAITDGQAHHLAMRQSTSGTKLYVDGSLVASSSLYNTVVLNPYFDIPSGLTYAARLITGYGQGPTPGTVANNWNGNVAKLAFYHVDLAEDRIVEHAQSALPQPLAWGLESMDAGVHRLYFRKLDISRVRYILDRTDAARIRVTATIADAIGQCIVRFTDFAGARATTTLASNGTGARTLILEQGQMSLSTATKIRDLALAERGRTLATGTIEIAAPVWDRLDNRLVDYDELRPGCLIAMPTLAAATRMASGLPDLRDGLNIFLIDSVQVDYAAMKATIQIEQPATDFARYLANIKPR